MLGVLISTSSPFLRHYPASYLVLGPQYVGDVTRHEEFTLHRRPAADELLKRQHRSINPPPGLLTPSVHVEPDCQCPGIKNYEDWERSSPEYTRYYTDPDGLVEFSDGSSYYGSDVAICYFGEDVGNGADTAVTIDSDATDCDALFGEGKTLGGYSVLTWDTRLISAVDLVGGSSGFDVSCTNHSVRREHGICLSRAAKFVGFSSVVAP